MDDLTFSYERELALLRQGLAGFAGRHPKVAARISAAGGDSEDIHAQRLLQSAALLNARARRRIEDDIPEFTAPLLDILYPEYVRAFPACSIACFEPASSAARLTRPARLPRGVELTARVGGYGFETVYDVVLGPYRIADAACRPASAAPSSVRLPEGAGGLLSISFEGLDAVTPLAACCTEPVRVFLDAEPAAVAATFDALLHRSAVAFSEADGSGRWKRLPAVPLRAVGFDEDDALIRRDDGLRSAFRPLLEYFAFARKFDFLDVDVPALLRGSGANGRVTLHVALPGHQLDGPAARAMAELQGRHFRLACTPVVNLFRCAAEPVSLNDAASRDYPLVPQTMSPDDVTIWSVEAVRIAATGTPVAEAAVVAPFHAMSGHGAGAPSAGGAEQLSWVAAVGGPRAADYAVSFVDPLGEPVARPQGDQIDADLRCTNGSLPSTMAWADPLGDFAVEDKSLVTRIALLQAPTESVRRPGRAGRDWRLIAALAASPLMLGEAGLSALKALLVEHLPRHASGADRRVDAIVGLTSEPAVEWMAARPQSRLVRGFRLRVSIDAPAFAGYAASTFARVLERVFERHVPASGFIQLVLVAAGDGTELVRGNVLAGTSPLI